MNNYQYTIEIERGEDNRFVVSVPALPGCFTQGETFEEAVLMAEDAIRGYLDLLIEDGEAIPIEHHPSGTEKLLVQVSPSAART